MHNTGSMARWPSAAEPHYSSCYILLVDIYMSNADECLKLIDIKCFEIDKICNFSDAD